MLQRRYNRKYAALLSELHQQLGYSSNSNAPDSIKENYNLIRTMRNTYAHGNPFHQTDLDNVHIYLHHAQQINQDDINELKNKHQPALNLENLTVNIKLLIHLYRIVNNHYPQQETIDLTAKHKTL